jgi:ABC-type branched-subunit amino acid transport system ATPase component
LLEVSTIDFFYGKTQALWGVSLKIDEVEIVALAGANGAGKWRTANILAMGRSLMSRPRLCIIDEPSQMYMLS